MKKSHREEYKQQLQQVIIFLLFFLISLCVISWKSCGFVSDLALNKLPSQAKP